VRCEKCSAEFENLKGLHLHIGKAHFTLQEYYHLYYPRFDLSTGSPISFKDYEDYFERDFNSKETFARWCLTEDFERVRDYIIQAFKNRCQKKNTNNIPSHLELKSLFLPSWFGLISIFKSKEVVTKNLSQDFQLKYDYVSTPSFSEIDPEILIDTREQFPLPFPKFRKMKLSCGDYSTSGELYSDIFIERKSLPDLVSTLSSGKERFNKEISRAKDLGYYLVVAIEDDFDNLMKLGPQNSFTKIANGKFILFSIRKILQDFDNIQFVFTGNRKESMRIIKRIFQMKEQVRKFDLEYLKDFEIL
jgi:DNA excision repair protein ERCC-4